MQHLDIKHFLEKHQLSEEYQTLTERWFYGLVEAIVMHHKSAGVPIVVGINGAQGSGKSTLADLIVYILGHHFKLRSVALSIDDFYLTKQARIQLSEKIHPLLLTRGVPGTHDVPLAIDTIKRLQSGQLPVKIPRFNKAIDDRFPEHAFEEIDQPLHVIILEGWCVGSKAQADTSLLDHPNTLESTEDVHGVWRHYVNQALKNDYPPLFNLINLWVMLKAPSFDCVFNWRLEQEQKLIAKVGNQPNVMNQDQIARFIQFFQRITTHTLNTLPEKAHYLFELNEKRQITKMTTKPVLMHLNTQWLVFTDMDGTLLDHFTYSFEPAVPSLKRLAADNIPVIPITSKTQAEVLHIRATLNNTDPFIIENGAAVFIPIGYFNQQPEDTVIQDNYWVKSFVAPRSHWQSLISLVRDQYAGQFITFSEAGVDGIVEMTGLPKASAAKAALRQFGEPLSWKGDNVAKQQFIQDLSNLGANVLEGGRFMHVSGKSDKGVALKWLSELFQKNAPNKNAVTIALGDSNNDKAMLETAAFAVVIRSPVHTPPTIDRSSGLYITKKTGPEGWAEAINQLIYQ